MVLIVSRSALKFWLNKLWKTIQKPVFFKVNFWFFKAYSFRTSRLTSKLLKSHSVDYFWFLDIPGTPKSNFPVEDFSFSCLFSAFLTNSATWWHFSLKSDAKFCGSSTLYIYDPRHLEFCQFKLNNTLFRKNVHSHS